NRLNVAVSRAKYVAVIVRSAQLTDYLPGTPDRLVELGAFLALGATGADTTALPDVTHDLAGRPNPASAFG
ncbi:MAG: hypothetical protein VYB90_04005, partial [Actinomycetota bacterium]|nr:hypothetical protein [Actinomycetota bacterium]